MNTNRRIISRRRRGTALLEFVMILPIFVFMILMSVDLGRMMLNYGAVSDASYIAARAGAQYGTASPAGRPGSKAAFANALAGMPGINEAEASLRIINGNCGSEVSYIVVEGSYPVKPFTPGLSAMLGVLNGTESFTLKTRAAVLCEVVRS